LTCLLILFAILPNTLDIFLKYSLLSKGIQHVMTRVMFNDHASLTS
jgi:hypothetical protein